MGPIEVCIVGGGMAGASVAFHLAPHARVTLLEREPHAGYHSSGRSAALYAPNYGSALIQRLTLAGESFLKAAAGRLHGGAAPAGARIPDDGQERAARRARRI